MMYTYYLLGILFYARICNFWWSCGFIICDGVGGIICDNMCVWK